MDGSTNTVCLLLHKNHHVGYVLVKPKKNISRKLGELHASDLSFLAKRVPARTDVGRVISDTHQR